MAVRSKSLYLGQPAAGAVTLYTVPAGCLTIVRSWYAINGNAAAQTMFLNITRGATAVLLPPLGITLASFGVIQSERWMTLQAGDQLGIVTALIGAQVVVSGAELVL